MIMNLVRTMMLVIVIAFSGIIGPRIGRGLIWVVSK